VAKPNFDLIPAALVVVRYFAQEQTAIEQLEAERDAISRQMEEMDEEHGGEDGLLSEAKTDKGRLTTKSVKERLKSIQSARAEFVENCLMNWKPSPHGWMGILSRWGLYGTDDHPRRLRQVAGTDFWNPRMIWSVIQRFQHQIVT